MGRPCPGPYQWWRMPKALERPGPHRRGDIGGLVVLLIGKAEARPGVELGAVDPELVLVGGGHVRRGPGDGPGRKGARWHGGRYTPRRRVRRAPGCSQRAVQSLVRKPVVKVAGVAGFTPSAVAVRRPDRPPVPGVGRQWGPAVGHERLLRRRHLDRCPTPSTPIRRARNHDPVAGLDRPPPGVGDLPGELHVVGVDARPDGSNGRRRVRWRGGPGAAGIPASVAVAGPAVSTTTPVGTRR